MPHSLFVVLLILLLGCTSGYAQSAVQQEEITLLRTFNGSHFWEFGNGELVAIDAAVWFPPNATQHEYIELLTPASSEGENAWWNAHRKWFRFYPSGYNPFFMGYGSGKPFHAVFALVESNNPPRREDSTLRIVWMTTLNGGFEKYSLIYTPLILKLPYIHRRAGVVRFPADTISPILTTKNNILLFPVQFVATENKVFSTVMYYTPHDKQWNFGGLTDKGTYSPAILEWKDDKLMMITQHTSGYYGVYESTDLGKNWKESTGTLSRVWTNSPINTERVSQNNFITATIDGKRVILFVQSVVSGEDKELHLWVTDNTRIHHVGLIVKDKKVKSSTLLFKDDKLYFRYETGERKGYGFLYMDTTTMLEKIKSALTAWTKQDTLVSKATNQTLVSCYLSYLKCKEPIPITTGLVGYLSGNIDGDKWKDEYLGVNAFVSGITERVTDGLKFMGVGAGAMWPVSINGPARQYHFTNYAFTLVATVAIHEVPKKGSSPLLGVKLKDRNGQEILLGVSYTNESKWSTINRGTTSKSTGTWELNNGYSVILTFENRESSVYINGTRLGVGADLGIAEEGEEISHFYFGAYSDKVPRTIHILQAKPEETVHISVKDVMLYNRVLSREEIDVLHKSKMSTLYGARDAEEILKKIMSRPNVVNSPPLEATKIQQNATSQDNATPTQTETPTATLQPEPSTEVATQSENKTAVTATAQTQENQHSTQSTEKQEQNKAPEALNESTHAEPPEKDETTEATTTGTTVPVSSTNTMQQDLLRNTTQSMINNNVNAHKNKSIDGTVRIYESVLPMLLLGLWALVTVFP
ncbi:uncharacterized protein TM35_001291050 [Trypanosoma theileri]|uniref:Uncharacterized protein n=1 Tax=Trypanosoma theileri TaxID=67003 RepID=A0A1X0NFE6_9TRYP|nr:uncharacterized protein TM35_001291050 [Trypanosoma theileri]ORC81142.1 hypothetical protein TM35_001291050 [Trypanosoma theileri]